MGRVVATTDPRPRGSQRHARGRGDARQCGDLHSTRLGRDAQRPRRSPRVACRPGFASCSPELSRRLRVDQLGVVLGRILGRFPRTHGGLVPVRVSASHSRFLSSRSGPRRDRHRSRPGLHHAPHVACGPAMPRHSRRRVSPRVFVRAERLRCRCHHEIRRLHLGHLRRLSSGIQSDSCRRTRARPRDHRSRTRGRRSRRTWPSRHHDDVAGRRTPPSDSIAPNCRLVSTARRIRRPRVTRLPGLANSDLGRQLRSRG